MTHKANGFCRTRSQIPLLPSMDSLGPWHRRVLHLRLGLDSKRDTRRHHCVVDRQTVFRRASLVRDVLAIRFEAGGFVKLVQVPKPEPGPEDVVVQVLAAGVCRTDLHLLDEVKAGTHAPIIPGHEIAGRIATIGADVYTAKVGDLVGVHFEQPCGRCRQCRRQRTNLCEDGTTLGFDAPGGYAEFVVAKQTTILPLPPNLDLAFAAPLRCSGATAYRAVVAFGQAEEEDMVVIIGAGGVGLSAIQVSKAYNARVFAIEPRVEARKAALDCGADRAGGPDEAGVAFRDFANDAGADVAIDFVGTVVTFELGRSLLGPGGRFVAVAPGSEAVEVTANDLVVGGKAYLGAYSSTMADFARAISLAEAGRLRPVVTRKAPLAHAAEVLNDLRDGKIVGRAVLFPGPMG